MNYDTNFRDATVVIIKNPQFIGLDVQKQGVIGFRMTFSFRAILISSTKLSTSALCRRFPFSRVDRVGSPVTPLGLVAWRKLSSVEGVKVRSAST